MDLTITRDGVSCTDPVWDALNRDPEGALWEAWTGLPSGKPVYAAELHPERQLIAMESLLCAGCKQDADRNELGMLWVLPVLDHAEDTVWEGVRTVTPPMCEACASEAKLRCPRLREGWVELRVREAELVGVRGTLHPRPGSNAEPDPDALVLYGSADLPFVVARGLVRELANVALVAAGAALP
ncbi:hypothetical protein [Streptomyces sp. NPDC058758]|uniref:hypothetical protein n=1 Tax=Streptomyces sp. NPDC058758 TaxID=3346627 RepID=UPI00367D28FF